jgi:hypothetical protein
MIQNDLNDQEINLSQLAENIKKISNLILDKLFNIFLFLKKQFFILITLIIVGVAMGAYISKATKSYEQKIIVKPNFKSIDYLYNKIDLINAKLDEKDSAFFNSINITNYNDIMSISIEPIIDIYNFVENNGQPTNLELIKLMATDPNVGNIIKDKVTSKNFKNHLIEFKTKNKYKREELIEPLLEYLNDSEYYSKIKVLALETSLRELKNNDSTLVQIDKILDQLSKAASNKSSSQSIYINNSDQINDLINQKKTLAKQKTAIQIDLINETHTIKEISSTTNTLELQQKNGDYKFLFPIYFVLAFILIKIFVAFYKSQIKKRNIS